MAKLIVEDGKAIINCDCGAVHTITKDKDGNFEMESIYKKTEPPAPVVPVVPEKKKSIFDDLF